MYKFIDVRVYFDTGSFKYFADLQVTKIETMSWCKDVLINNSKTIIHAKKLIRIDLYSVTDMGDFYEMDCYSSYKIKYFFNFNPKRVKRSLLNPIFEQIGDYEKE